MDGEIDKRRLTWSVDEYLAHLFSEAFFSTLNPKQEFQAKALFLEYCKMLRTSHEAAVEAVVAVFCELFQQQALPVIHGYGFLVL